MTTFSVQMRPCWFLASCWSWFIFLCARTHKRRRWAPDTFFSISNTHDSSNIFQRQRERDTKRTEGQMKAGRRRMETDEGTVESGRGKETMLMQSQHWSQNVTDTEKWGRRWAENMGGGAETGVGVMQSWVKAPKLPQFLYERYSAEKIDSMCPLCQGMPKTMTSSLSPSKLARTQGESPRLTLWSFIHYYSLADHQVFRFKKT